MRVALWLCVLFASACAPKQGHEPAPHANEPAPQVVTNQAPQPAPPDNPTPEPDKTETAEPTKAPEESSGFSVESVRKSFPGQYARDLKLLYIEQSPRWQWRAMNEMFKRDKGLRYQGFLIDAQEGWTQPTSIWSDEIKKEVHPLRAPFYDTQKARKVTTKDEFLALGYDVIIIGDVSVSETGFQLEYWDWIQEFVANGGGLVLLAGKGFEPTEHGKSESYLALQPVTIDAGDPFPGGNVMHYYGIVDSTLDHPALRLSDSLERDTEHWGREVEGKYEQGQLNGFYAHANVTAVADDATVLMRRATNGEPVADGTPILVVRPHGKGRVLFLGTDDTWLMRELVGDFYFGRFHRNLVAWAANAVK